MTAADYKQARKELGMTQEQLAYVLGVSRKTINRRERGKVITHEGGLAIYSLLRAHQIK